MASAEPTAKAVWEVKTLGEVCSVFNGNSISRKEKEDNYVGLSEGTPYIATKDVSFEHEVTYENGVLIPEAKKKDFKIVPPNSVLVCAEGGSAGRKIAFNTREAHFGNKLFASVPENNLNGKFLFYFFITNRFFEIFSELMAGLIGGVSLKKFKSISVPIPPLPEQERIVGILDEAFEGIAAATAQAEKNLHNARELFQSVLQSTFSQKGDDWEEATLGENANFRNGMNFSRNSRGQTVKVVGVGDFKQRFWVPTESLDDKTIDGKLDKQDQLLEDDFLFVRSNGNKELIGRCMLTGSISAPITHSGFTIRMRLEEPDFFPLFLCWYLKSDQARNSLIGSGSGAQISNLNQGTLSALTVPKPPIPTQQAIVEKLDALSEETKALEAIYERKQSALAELKQSLLQKAFAGEL